MPSVIYALLACGERILADHTNPRFTGDFRATAVKLLSKAQRSSDKEVTFNLQGHVFSFSAKGADMWYCAMSDEAYGKQMPFFFINDVAEAFTKQFEDPASLSDSIVKAQFGAKLSAKVEQYSNPDDSDKVARAQTSLDELRVVLTDNVELAVKRNTDLNAIADTASTLLDSTERLKRSSRQMRRRLCWADAKLKLIGCLLGLFILYSFTASFCGLNLKHC